MKIDITHCSSLALARLGDAVAPPSSTAPPPPCPAWRRSFTQRFTPKGFKNSQVESGIGRLRHAADDALELHAARAEALRLRRQPVRGSMSRPTSRSRSRRSTRRRSASCRFSSSAIRGRARRSTSSSSETDARRQRHHHAAAARPLGASIRNVDDHHRAVDASHPAHRIHRPRGQPNLLRLLGISSPRRVTPTCSASRRPPACRR